METILVSMETKRQAEFSLPGNCNPQTDKTAAHSGGGSSGLLTR
jgi:hypothetical protein